MPRASIALLALFALAPAVLSGPAPVDRFGDPLPAGARARVGTARLTRLVGDSGWAGAVLTPDGAAFLTAARRGPLVRLDVRTGRPAGAIGDADPLRTGSERLSLSAAGGRVAESRVPGVVVRDARTGAAVATIPVPGMGPVTLSGNGRVAATVAFGPADGPARVVVVWDVDRDIRLSTIGVEPTDGVGTTLSGDGRVLATWGEVPRAGDGAGDKRDWRVQFWDAVTGKTLGKWAGALAGWVAAVALSPDGSTAAVAEGGAVQLVDTRTGRAGRGFAVTPEWSHQPAFSSDGKVLAGVSTDGEVRAWEVATGKQLFAVPCPVLFPPVLGSYGKTSPVTTAFGGGLAFTGPGRLVAWGNTGPVAVAWEVPSGKVLSPVDRPLASVDELAWTPDGRHLLTPGPGWQVRRWDAATGAPAGSVTLAAAAADPRGVHLLPGARRVIGSDGPFGRALYDAGTGAKLHGLPALDRGGVVSRDADLVLDPDGTVRDAAAGRTVVKLDPLPVGPPDMVRTPAGLVTAAVRTPGGLTPPAVPSFPLPGSERPALVVTLWDPATGKKRTEADVPGGQFHAALADGRSVVVTDRGGAARTLDLVTGKLGPPGPSARPVPDWAVRVVAVSPDGKLLAVAAGGEPRDDRPDPPAVLVCDAATGRRMHRFIGHAGPVQALAFSPDGRSLASGGQDTTVLVWDLADAAGKP